MDDDLHPDSPLMNMSHTFLGEGMLSLSIPGPTRDSTYYISDGNSVFLVGNTLFKVHRSTLTKDKSAFETMFQLSSETDSSRSESSITMAMEGESDENPIRLQGDTPDEFRALLWSLYSLPHELLVALTPDANCSQLVNLARISNKYQYRSLETWALGALSGYFSRPGAFDALPTGSPPVASHHTTSLSPFRSPSLVQITELAALCERHDLLELAMSRWQQLTVLGADLALAIDVGERFNLRAVLGPAYHAMMLKGKNHWDSDALLTRERRVRLLCGYYSIMKLSESISNTPPVLTHNARCTAQARCTKAFGQLWKTAMEMPVAMQKEDILKRLMFAESMLRALAKDEIPLQEVFDGTQHCKDNVLFTATLRIREIKDSLADHFSDDF